MIRGPGSKCVFKDWFWSGKKLQLFFFFFFEAPTFESQCWGPSKAKLTVIHSIVQTLESVSRSDHPLERTAAWQGHDQEIFTLWFSYHRPHVGTLPVAAMLGGWHQQMDEVGCKVLLFPGCLLYPQPFEALPLTFTAHLSSWHSLSKWGNWGMRGKVTCLSSSRSKWWSWDF